mmetsp:Transcript_85739/g.154392  ORF Transcript_85739/g.154392 Transcript_85739/m.154392 type:complete len:256 (+) Transcript_85739:397-1164(+)
MSYKDWTSADKLSSSAGQVSSATAKRNLRREDTACSSGSSFCPTCSAVDFFSDNFGGVSCSASSLTATSGDVDLGVFLLDLLTLWKNASFRLSCSTGTTLALASSGVLSSGSSEEFVSDTAAHDDGCDDSPAEVDLSSLPPSFVSSGFTGDSSPLGAALEGNLQGRSKTPLVRPEPRKRKRRASDNGELAGDCFRLSKLRALNVEWSERSFWRRMAIRLAAALQSAFHFAPPARLILFSLLLSLLTSGEAPCSVG